ncbi:MAG: hypothetical protein JJ913_17285 [Rhizobiaceae bacterium]|nr:hypothetical protein [Rhizobiaceae bacterium]
MRRETAPIDSTAAMFTFVSSRSAFVAQKKLYGYLKTRMGTRFPSMFEDDVFVGSINIAKMHVFAACLADMTVHAISRVTAGSGLSADERNGLAMRCFETGIADNRDHAPEGAEAAWKEAFAKRLEGLHWENLASGGTAFTESPKALVRWAPIADELKRYDREIVENSVTFSWPEHTRDFAARAVPEAIVEDWKASQAK